MKKEYDFSKGVRGWFFKPDTTLNLPTYLDSEIQNHLRERAQSKGIELNQLVNELLRKNIDMIESAR